MPKASSSIAATAHWLNRAEKEAISVERMRVEMANFVDDVGPEVRRRIRDMLGDDDRELSLTSLVQVQRVVLDTVKFLDRGEGNEEPLWVN